MKNVLKPSPKCSLIPLRLTAAASATDATTKNVFVLSMTTLIVSNDTFTWCN